jgi:hypothetical protein
LLGGQAVSAKASAVKHSESVGIVLRKIAYLSDQLAQEI